MYTIDDVRKLLDQMEKHQENLLRIYRSEVADDGAAHDDTIKYFNDSMFAVSRAYEILDKGLEGEF